jgi:uncharacterized protein YcaQ
MGRESQPLDPGDALEEAARRFLGVNGPATREDLSRWWGGLSPARAGRLIAGMGDEVVEVDVEGKRAWMLAKHVAGVRRVKPTGSVRLIPAFDPYVIGATRHAERLMTGPNRERVYRPQAWISPVLLVDGRMDGVWRHERKGRKLLVTIDPFGKVASGVRGAVEKEAERLRTFLGGELELRWSHVR